MSVERISNQKVSGEIYQSHPAKSVVESIRRLYRTNFWKLLIVVVAGVALLFALLGATVGSVLLQLVFAPPMSSPATLPMLDYRLPIFIIIVVSIFMTLLTDYLYTQSQNGLSTPLGIAIRRSFKRVLPALAVYFLTGLIILLGLLALIIPGIYLALRLSYTRMIVINEDLGPIETIKRSWTLTRGHLGDIIGVLSVIVLVASLINLLYVVFALATNGLGGVIGGIIYIIATVLMTLVSIILNAGVYFRYHQSALAHDGQLEKDGTNNLNFIALFAAIIGMFALGSVSAATSPSQDIQSEPQFETNVELNET